MVGLSDNHEAYSRVFFCELNKKILIFTTLLISARCEESRLR